MESSVKVQNLGKLYNIDKNNFLPQFRKKDQNTLQDTKAVAALSNVSFEIFKGDRLGVLGKNGAGKSTLLKIISKVTTPTLGQVEINGVVSSVLEFGAGFHQDLTGLENIYLSGAILGMSRKEINRKIKKLEMMRAWALTNGFYDWVGDYNDINIDKFHKKYILGKQCARKKIPTTNYCMQHVRHRPHGNYLEPPSKELCIHFMIVGGYLENQDVDTSDE